MSPAVNPPVFHILLALSDGALHGLGIAERVEGATDGSVQLGPGTLYRSLKEMTVEGLIHEVDAPENADPRRRYYELTARGRRLAEEEAERLERIVGVARDRNLLPRRA
jgi:DNA-binding PadR family transcriptional regulator